MSRPARPKDLHYYTWRGAAWMASETHAVLDALGRGIYRELLDICYLQGSFMSPTSDLEGIARRCACTVEQFQTVWPKIKKHFLVSKNDAERLTNPQADLVRRQFFGFCEGQRKHAKKRWTQEAAEAQSEHAGTQKETLLLKSPVFDYAEVPEESTTSHGYPNGYPMPNLNLNIKEESSSSVSSVVHATEQPADSLSENQKSELPNSEPIFESKERIPDSQPTTGPSGDIPPRPIVQSLHNRAWKRFREIAMDVGLAGSEIDWREAYTYQWRQLDPDQQKAAAEGLKARKGSDDSALTALPKNYLAKRMWERPIRRVDAQRRDQHSDDKLASMQDQTMRYLKDIQRRKEMLKSA